MQTQHNEIRKPFDPELYASTQVKMEWVKKIFPVIKVIPKQEEDYGIDSYWVQNTCSDLSNFKKNEIIAGIEWEKATSSSWGSVRFPYGTASFLTRKDHYVNLGFKAYFIRLNSEESNAYVMPIDEEMLKPSYVKEISRAEHSMAKEGEKRYLIPAKLMIFGFECIEPFLVYRFLNGRSDAKSQFDKYCKTRSDLGLPVTKGFYHQLKFRNFLLQPKP